MISVYRLPEGLPQDLEQLRQMAEQFQAGTIPAARFQAFRVPQGIYEQRESGTFMLRARLAAGILQPAQMRVAADVAETYGNGVLHLTSRQDLQVHGVQAEGIHPAVAKLTEAGLSTKGGGGNTVRNIAACYQAGVCPDEVFDVSPYVVHLTESLLPDPLSFQLPRKYKIAFSGCGADCAGATVNDVGFISKRRAGEEGFAVYVAGGMGAQSSAGRLLEEFVPAADAFRVAEAVKRVFDKHGNRKNRHRARIRFLVEDLGFHEFENLYRAELEHVRDVLEPQAPGALPGPVTQGGQAAPEADGFEAWLRTNVAPQKQSGYYTVEIAPPLGVIEVGQFRQLAEVVARYGERALRATNWQSTLLRWVRRDELPGLHAELARLNLGTSEPPILRRLVVCAGASTCRLGICLSRGLAKAVREALLASGLDLDGDAGRISIHISGCPNACGRHPIAQIGLFGVARRVKGRLAPHYVVQFGGRVQEGGTTLASGAYIVPARSAPAFLVDVLRAFQSSPQRHGFEAFLAADGRKMAEALAARYSESPDFAKDKNFYSDWDAEEVFSLAGRGAGECGAGVFDLIEVDLASAEEALRAERVLAATALASRALLVTRGEQADTDRHALDLSFRHFIAEDLVAASFGPLIEKAQRALDSRAPEAAFDCPAGDVAGLLFAVRRLYEDMGPSLRLPTSACTAPPVATAAPAATIADLTHDFRGVACPLNYVKTKMALASLKVGQVLAILLDEQGAQSVPASASADGHEILSVTREERHWRVMIRKDKR